MKDVKNILYIMFSILDFIELFIIFIPKSVRQVFGYAVIFSMLISVQFFPHQYKSTVNKVFFWIVNEEAKKIQPMFDKLIVNFK